jgi:hypothetical protein
MIHRNGLTIRRLPGYLTFRELQDLLGYTSRAGIHELVFTTKAFDEADLACVPTSHQPLYLIRVEAAHAYKTRRDAARGGRVHPYG